MEMISKFGTKGFEMIWISTDAENMIS